MNLFSFKVNEFGNFILFEFYSIGWKKGFILFFHFLKTFLFKHQIVEEENL